MASISSITARCARCSNGTRRAIGSFARAMITSSPASTMDTSSESRAFASSMLNMIDIRGLAKRGADDASFQNGAICGLGQALGWASKRDKLLYRLTACQSFDHRQRFGDRHEPHLAAAGVVVSFFAMEAPPVA